LGIPGTNKTGVRCQTILKDNVVIYCDKNDGVCGGKLQVKAGRFLYAQDETAPKAVAFLKSKIEPKLKGGREF
jgi:hypothetical protein